MAMAQVNCPNHNLPVPPSDECMTAPPFCASYLDGYCSSNAGYTADAPGNLGNAFGCSIENNQWLTFVPCGSTVLFELSVGNCGIGGGMEFVILATTDCQNFTALNFCFTVANGQTATLNVNGLQVGNTYYLMVDGVNGDTCTWKVETLIGASNGGVLQEDITPGSIQGPDNICQFIPATYSAIGPVCLVEPADPANPNCPPGLDFTCPPALQQFSNPFIDTTYSPIAWDTIWHITPSVGGFFVNNDSVGSSVQILWSGISPCILDADFVAVEFDTLIFLNDGIEACNSICPDPDPCDILPLTVYVNGPPSPPIITGPTQICEGQSATFFAIPSSPTNSITWVVPNGLSFTAIPNNGIIVPSASPGQYCAVAENFCGVSAPGCHNVGLINIQTNLAFLQLCQDDLPYNFFGQMVTASGNYQVVLNNWQGCDSIVTQQITVLPAVSVSIVSSVGTNIPAGGTATLDAGAGFASYHWSDNSTGQTLATDQPGTYAVTVTSVAGCTVTDSITLTQVINNSPTFNLPVAPADSCGTAPPFCASYLLNYSSSNSGYGPDMPGNLASVIPCNIENNQWLSFVACSDSAQIALEVNSCVGAMGLEFYVLQTNDCQVFATQSACHEITDGTTDTLILPNLHSGETYYLMVDGMGGDICNWKVLATQGISDGATLQEENTPGQVTGPTAMCAGATATFTFTEPICNLIPVGGCPAAMQQFCTPHLDTCIAVQYDTIWHVTPFGTVFLNNDSMGLTVMITFPDSLPIPPDSSSMIFTVSVELVPLPGDTLTCPSDCVSACGTIIPDSEPCGILPLNVTVGLPQNTAETQVVCPGGCVDFYGQTFCQPGTYTVTDTSIYGCVNTHELTLDWIQESPPFITGLLENCNASGTEYTVSFDVISNGFLTVNGQPLNGSNFTSPPIPSGQPYNFTVEMLGQCQVYAENVSGVVDCPPCMGGTFDLGTMSLCPGSCFDLQGTSFCAPGSYQEQFLNPQTNCIETYVFTLTQIVENQLVVGSATEFCDASNLYYSVGFSIEDGAPPFYVNGNQIPGNFYQSGLIPSGQPYAFTVTDAATCSPQQITLGGSYNCACLNSPGTMALATINQCEGEMASANFNNDAVIGPNDIQVFILHTGSGSSLGTVIGTNTTGSFGFVPNLMSYGTAYYISSAVGPDLGGVVDMNSPCFGFSPGQPVVFYTVPSVEILPADTLTCAVNSLSLTSLPSGGSGDFSYAWEGPSGFTASTPYPTVGEGGAYLLLLTDNLTGCEAQTATAVLSDVTTPVFTVTNSEINCQQANATLEAASQMNGVTYTWTFPTGDVMTGDIISTNIPGDYAVTAMGTNGCITNATTFVTDNGTSPSLAVTSGTLNCSAATVELIATSNQASATFTWTLPDATTTTGSSLSTSLVGSYTVVASTPNGCTTEATTAVAEGPDPELVTEVEVTNPTCHGFSDGSIKVLGTTGGTAPYAYTLNDSLMGDFFQGLPGGDYLLRTADANGCVGLDTVQVVGPPEVMVYIGDDQFINLGQSVTLTMQASITPSNIIWYGPNGETWPAVSELTISPKESGRYTIVISDVSSCRSSDTTSVYIKGEGKVYIPNAFSPNGDSENDVFMLFAGGDVEQVLNIQIFDRWGEMVFEDHAFLPGDATHGWDGRKRGRAMDPAVFIVKAMVKFKDGTTKMVTGDVVLLR